MGGVLKDKKSEIDMIVLDIINVSGESRFDCSNDSHMYSVKGSEKNSNRDLMVFATEYFDGEINPFVLEIVIDQPVIENYSEFSFATAEALIGNLSDQLRSKCAGPSLCALLLKHMESRIDHLILTRPTTNNNKQWTNFGPFSKPY